MGCAGRRWHDWGCSRSRWSGDGIGGSAQDGESEGCWCSDRDDSRTRVNHGRSWAVGSTGSNGNDRSSSRKGLGLRAWAIGDGESGLRRNCVGLVALDNSGRSRAVGGVSGDSLSGGDPDWSVGAVDWSNIGGRWGVGRLDRLGDGARAVSDGQSLRSGGSVRLGALSEGGALRAVGGIHISGDSSVDGSLIPAGAPSRAASHEKAESDELGSLHVERLYCIGRMMGTKVLCVHGTRTRVCLMRTKVV